MLARPRTMICLWPNRGVIEPNRKTKLSRNIWEETFSLPRTHLPPCVDLHLPGSVCWPRTGAWPLRAAHPAPAAARVSPARPVGVAGLLEEVLEGPGDQRGQAQGRVEPQQIHVFQSWA